MQTVETILVDHIAHSGCDKIGQAAHVKYIEISCPYDRDLFSSVGNVGRVLDTVLVSANHLVKNETADSKDPVRVGKKQIP